MSDEKIDRPAGETPAEDDVEGHVIMRPALSSEDDDVEGHALFRSPSSRGE